MNDTQLMKSNVITRLQDAWEIVNMRGDAITPETRAEMDAVLSEIAQQTGAITDMLGSALNHIENQEAVINELRFQRDQLARSLNIAHEEARKTTLRNLVAGIACELEECSQDQIRTFIDAMNGEYNGILSRYDVIAIEELVQEISGIIYEEQQQLKAEVEEMTDDRD